MKAVSIALDVVSIVLSVYVIATILKEKKNN